MLDHLLEGILHLDLDEIGITGCQRSCQENTFPVTAIEELAVPGGLTGFYFYFPYMSYSLHEEVLLYDSNQILAGVGGSLGLFLGFSCRGFLVDLVDYVRSIYGSGPEAPMKKIRPMQK